VAFAPVRRSRSRKRKGKIGVWASSPFRGGIWKGDNDNILGGPDGEGAVKWRGNG